MSEPGPFPGGNFFEGILGDLMRMMRTEGPVNWEMARQVAVAVASGGHSEPNVEPLERMRLEELVRVAELHVAQVAGTFGGSRPLSPRCVTRAEWAWHSLEHWRPVIEAMARALSAEAPEAEWAGQPAEGGE
ncbi:MAG TPA: zinc-dependent metalloprotease, partial [Acidimicrobiales bacterium]|nr:zinc-dependent metalloprotease [Acidimicrobiales bacterium]